MTHTPAPAEIETLRKIVNGELDREVDYAAIIAANKTLDRLSPPEPEQPDEATVWTEKLIAEFYSDHPQKDTITRQSGVAFSRARQVLADLIASKDAERELIEVERDEWKLGFETVAKEWNKCESELAALRAENERLKETLRGQEAVSDHVHEALWAADKAAERNPAEPDILSVRAERALGQIPAPDTAPVVDETTQRLAARMGAKFVKNERWPERNPAGPGPWPGDPDHRETMPVDTAPVDKAQTCDFDAYNDLMSDDNYDDPNFGANYFMRHRTEAEARGRREALECAQYIAEHVDDATTAKALQPIIDELKRLMTEGK